MNRRMRIFVNVLLLSLPLAVVAQKPSNTMDGRRLLSVNCAPMRQSAAAAASGWQEAPANSPIRYGGTSRP